MSKHRTTTDRTAPPGTAPFVAVIHGGPPRHCVNFCAHLERSGFQTLCGDRLGREPQQFASFLIPDAIVVRIDDPAKAGTVRPEFDRLAALRQGFPGKLIAMSVEGKLTPAEQELATAQSVRIFNRKIGGHAPLVRAVHESIAEPPFSPPRS